MHNEKKPKQSTLIPSQPQPALALCDGGSFLCLQSSLTDGDRQDTTYRHCLSTARQSKNIGRNPTSWLHHIGIQAAIGLGELADSLESFPELLMFLALAIVNASVQVNSNWVPFWH